MPDLVDDHAGACCQAAAIRLRWLAAIAGCPVDARGQKSPASTCSSAARGGNQMDEVAPSGSGYYAQEGQPVTIQRGGAVGR